MITLKSSRELEFMRLSGKITAAARALAGAMVEPGVSTREINKEVHRFIKSKGAVPSFLGYNGFPASVLHLRHERGHSHGIPGGPDSAGGGHRCPSMWEPSKNGFHRRLRRNLPLRKISDEAQRLHRRDPAELLRRHPVRPRGATACRNLCGAIQRYVEDNGFSVVREYVGHGLGSKNARGAGSPQLCGA